jgi:hypothetical protein
LEEWVEENDEKIEEVKIYRVTRWSSRKKMKKLLQYKVVKYQFKMKNMLTLALYFRISIQI